MCENYQFKADYFNGEYIKDDLFSDEAERVVKCFLSKSVNKDGRDRRGNPRKKLSSTQIRKFYEEVLNLKAQYDNGKSFREILPYFKMLKAYCEAASIDTTIPFNELESHQRGAILNGGVVVRQCSFIGSGAVCREGIEIPEKSFVKAGSIVK